MHKFNLPCFHSSRMCLLLVLSALPVALGFLSMHIAWSSIAYVFDLTGDFSPFVAILLAPGG
jgi:hypothetical protein